MFESAKDIFSQAQTYQIYWEGLVVTAQLVLLSLLIGGLLAVPLAIMRTSKKPWVNGPVWLFTYVFRGTPLFGFFPGFIGPCGVFGLIPATLTPLGLVMFRLIHRRRGKRGSHYVNRLLRP